jgi:hypothetical protein
VYTEGKRTRDKISSNIRETLVQSCSTLIFLWLKYNWIHEGKFGIPCPPHYCACPKQGPGCQSRGLFYVKGVKVKVIIRFAEIGGNVDQHWCRVLNIVVIVFFIFSFDHLTIVKQSLVIHLMACNSFKYWLKCPIIKPETISQLCPSV